jgi:hypothetical protein
MEVIAHFIPPLFELKGHVRYSAKGLYSRASVLFLIVLGQGEYSLDLLAVWDLNVVNVRPRPVNEHFLFCSRTSWIWKGFYWAAY